MSHVKPRQIRLCAKRGQSAFQTAHFSGLPTSQKLRKNTRENKDKIRKKWADSPRKQKQTAQSFYLALHFCFPLPCIFVFPCTAFKVVSGSFSVSSTSWTAACSAPILFRTKHKEAANSLLWYARGGYFRLFSGTASPGLM